MNALVVFEAAARHRNLTAAGAELCIAASAVSRHVATVERETGLVLFIRNGNRIELTSTGQRLADVVGAGLGHVRDLLSSLKQRDVDRTLTIACSHDLAHSWLMPRFRELAELLSDWKLRVITAGIRAIDEHGDPAFRAASASSDRAKWVSEIAVSARHR
jgi:LysR family glycine cleavage system transcriptional activator